MHNVDHPFLTFNICITQIKYNFFETFNILYIHLETNIKPITDCDWEWQNKIDRK